MNNFFLQKSIIVIFMGFHRISLKISRNNEMKKIIAIVLGLAGLASCTTEPVSTYLFDDKIDSGVFISCEGNYMYGNSSLSFYNDKSRKISNQIFYAVNNVPLGDVAQSLAVYENSLFIVVNNSGKIYVVDSKTIKFKGIIKGLVSPRYIHICNSGKAYVSDLYAGQLVIFNPKTLQVMGKINIPGKKSSEQMVQVGKYVYVTSWLAENQVYIIDTENDLVVDSIKTPFQPKNIVKDIKNKIWVTSDGGYNQKTKLTEKSSLLRIDPETRTIEKIFTQQGNMPVFSGLQVNPPGDTLCFVCGDVFKMAVTDKNLPPKSFIPSRGKLIYSMGINPSDGEIYFADANNYTADSWIFRYTKAGTGVDSFKVGINPSYFLFVN